MARQCTVCAHTEKARINSQLIEGEILETLSKVYNLTPAALNRHKQNHLPEQLIKAQSVRQVAAADSLMERVTSLNEKAESVYIKAIKSNNLTAATQAIRELRGITELYAKITGELTSQSVNNIIVMPEWLSLRNLILFALDPYPEARQAVVKALGEME